MNKPYHEVKGAARIFGYVNEEGVKTQVRMLPNSLDPIQIQVQLGHIAREFCKEEIKNPQEDQLEPDKDYAKKKAAAAEARKKRGKISEELEDLEEKKWLQGAVHASRAGMFDGWSLEKLEAEAAKGGHTRSRAAQLNFAIRAKKGHGIHESYGEAATSDQPSLYGEHDKYKYHKGRFYHNNFERKLWKPGDHWDDETHLQSALNRHLSQSGQYATKKEAHIHAHMVNSAHTDHRKILDSVYPNKEDQPGHKIIDVITNKIHKKLKAHDSHMRNLEDIDAGRRGNTGHGV